MNFSRDEVRRQLRATRAEHEATMARMRSQPQHVQTAGDRAAIERMPEM